MTALGRGWWRCVGWAARVRPAWRVEYAHRQLAGVGVAWQFAAEDPAVLAAGFGELAAQLGAADGGDPVASVHGVLAASPAPWLLVFDNAPDRASVAPFVPPAGPGRVLITSRNQIWPPGQALDVPVLDPRWRRSSWSAGPATRTSGRPWTWPVSWAGCRWRWSRPLPTSRPAGTAWPGTWHRSGSGARTCWAVASRPGTPETVATTWRLAFEDLRQAAAGAAGLLRLLAFCAPEAIPLRLLLQPRPGLAGRLGEQVASVLAPLLEDELAAGDAIAALRRYSLVTPAADGSVSVHRLVQAVTADQMPAELAEAWRQAAAALIEAAIPDDTTLPKTWPTCAALLPHAQAALAMTAAGWRESSSTSDRAAATRRPETSTERPDARERVLGPEHPDTLAARDDLALWTGEAGDPAAARDQYAALLPVLERVLCPEHPRTLDARHELAGWTGEAGDPAAARDQFAALLPIHERVLGPEHPDSLAARDDLACWTGEAGDPAAARDQFAALLPVRERVLGPEHPDTLATRHELAHWTGEAGDAAAARDQLAALLPKLERVLGPEHPETLMARHDLARWTGQAGDAAAARDQFAGAAGSASGSSARSTRKPC